MSVTKLSDHAADPRTAILEMEEHIRTVGEVQWALDGYAHLFSGEHTRDLDHAQVGCMVRSLAQQLDTAHQKLTEHHERAHRALNGNRPLPGENDLYLCRLSEEYREICEANTGIVSDDESALMDKMLATPADSIIGVAAKLAAVSGTRDPEPTEPADKLEHRALVEIEQLGGFGPRKQAAE
jgi:hypothetical protein